jgi:glycosyltransferase involved in cell wall biosynthesis
MLGLLELLPGAAPAHEYFLYANDRVHGNLPAGIFTQRTDGAFRRLPGAMWLLGRCGALARTDDLDIFWASTPVLPLRLPPRVVKIVTVYDIVWLRCPETTTRYNLLIQRLCARRAISDADYVIAISRSTQDELIHSLGIPKEKTRVIYCGVAERYKSQDPSGAAKYISRKYAVPERYLATVGIVHPRKNQHFLVKVLEVLKKCGQLDCPLLVVGPIGWKNSPLFREIQQLGLTENEIRFLGYLPDEDMPAFYAGAQAFLFPTLYEGFGLPPVEAMACGTPVVASDAPSMPEVLGDAAILQPATNPQRFAASVVQVLTDDNLRRTLRAKGLHRAQLYKYANSVQQLAAIFDEVAAARNSHQGQVFSGTFP